jgi:transcriptional regulator
MKDPGRDLFPGALEMMILQILRRDPLHGYALAQRIKHSSGELLQVEEGSLYPALYRMEKRGWIEAEWGTSEVGRKAKIYRLTSVGRKQLRLETAEWSHFASAVSRVLMPSP